MMNRAQALFYFVLIETGVTINLTCKVWISSNDRRSRLRFFCSNISGFIMRLSIDPSFAFC